MSRFLNKRLSLLEEYIPGEQPQDKNYIKLNTNESPYPPSNSVLKAVNDTELKNLRLYSDPKSKLLKAKLAAHYSLKSEQVFVSNGSDEILNFAFMAYGENGAAFPDITYGFYSVFANLYGIKAEVVPLNEDFTINIERFLGLNKLIAIANPNAPTGIAIDKELIEKVVKSNPNSIVIIDEAYVDFGAESCKDLINKYKNLLVVQTFSKSRSMAGARLGFAFADSSIIADLEKVKYSTNPYNVNRITQLCGIKALEEDTYYSENCKRIIKTREFTLNELEKLGFTVTPSLANFLFAKSEKISGKELYLKLKEKGILVRHFNSERLNEYNRITIGSYEEMTAFIAVIKEIVGGK